MRLKVERLAAMLTDSEKTKRDIVADDGEEVAGVRLGWGAWALLRAAVIDVIETKCEADEREAAPTPERADAEKDAVRYRWMRDQNKRMHYTTDYQPDGCTDLIQIEVPVVGEPIFTPEGHFDFSMELDRAIDAAILAANKEKK
jgi:hypothetical protein